MVTRLADLLYVPKELFIIDKDDLSKYENSKLYKLVSDFNKQATVIRYNPINFEDRISKLKKRSIVLDIYNVNYSYSKCKVLGLFDEKEFEISLFTPENPIPSSYKDKIKYIMYKNKFEK